MKTNHSDKRQVTSDLRNFASRSLRSADSIVNYRPSRSDAEADQSKIARESSFTLVELLVVIGIITVIAALIFPLAGAVKREAYLHATRSEMAELETAIERYHAAYGFYPPDNPGVRAPANNPRSALTNQLYYELEGTRQTNINGTVYYVTLDGNSTISVNDVSNSFGVSGFMNCLKPGADETAPTARNFLPDLKPDQIGTLSGNADNTTVDLLVASVGGPAGAYEPLGEHDGDSVGNPWRYRAPGINNPGSYDLWMQLLIGQKTNLVCNWTRQVQLNNAAAP